MLACLSPLRGGFCNTVMTGLLTSPAQIRARSCPYSELLSHVVTVSGITPGAGDVKLPPSSGRPTAAAAQFRTRGFASNASPAPKIARSRGMLLAVDAVITSNLVRSETGQVVDRVRPAST